MPKWTSVDWLSRVQSQLIHWQKSIHTWSWTMWQLLSERTSLKTMLQRSVMYCQRLQCTVETSHSATSSRSRRYCQCFKLPNTVERTEWQRGRSGVSQNSASGLQPADELGLHKWISGPDFLWESERQLRDFLAPCNSRSEELYPIVILTETCE